MSSGSGSGSRCDHRDQPVSTTADVCLGEKLEFSTVLCSFDVSSSQCEAHDNHVTGDIVIDIDPPPRQSAWTTIIPTLNSPRIIYGLAGRGLRSLAMSGLNPPHTMTT